ncbi:major facilitator superfamily MFS_1 [Ferroplasma acidarmanus Fer1]|uniref:Major facilitator superfamily MFS_1 n=2 Tax=Ferroplasma TaxID=74968 RepID=S0AQY7_FERAC|nr:major facilitator superfamily MFS_1 [Ferroplasma acidarmanus Fer1]
MQMVEEISMYDISRKELDKIEKSNKVFSIIILLVVFGTFFDAIEQYNAGYAASGVSSVFHISASVISTQVEFITFGFMAVGAVIAGYMGDNLGRRFLYSFNLGIYAIGALISALSVNYSMFLFGRIVVGLGLGGEVAIGLTLISEIMPTRVRSQLTGAVNVGPGFGIFAVAILALIFIGPYEQIFGGSKLAWRWFLGILILPALLILLYRRYIPETPRFLISKGRQDEAFAVIKMLSENKLIPLKKLKNYYKVDDLRQQYNYIGLKPINEKPKTRELFAGKYARRSLLLFILSFITFGTSASFTIIYPEIFTSVATALHLSSTFTLTTIVNFGTLLGTFTAVFLATKNRKILISTLGILAIIGAGLTVTFHSYAYIVVISLFIFAIFSYASNTTIWLYSPEMYPTRIRNIGTGFILATSLGGVAIMEVLTSYVYALYNLTGIGLVAIGAFVVYVILAFFMADDTSKKDLEVVSP